MLLAPFNDMVNDLAIRIKEAWLQFIPDHETIVVRYHVLSTKEDLLLMPAKKQRPHPANTRPPIIAEDDSTCDDGLLVQSWELHDAVLAYADAIICMLHAAGEQAMHDNVQPQAILVNEAARATKPELWPVLAFFNPNTFVLIGDHHQLCPLNSLHAVMLMEQHQMHESMAQMVSSVFYNGELQMSHATADQTCKLACQVNWFNYRTFRSPGQMLFLDVKDSFDHHDAQQCSYPAAITVLTLYRAQLREYQALFAMLELSVVVLNLTVVSSLGFMREGNHLNIALSWVKHALYIIGGTWDENGMDLDGMAARPGANNNHSATSGPPDATVEAQDDVQVSRTWNDNCMDLNGTAAQLWAGDNNSSITGEDDRSGEETEKVTEEEDEEESNKGGDDTEGEDGDQGGHKEKEREEAPEKETEKEQARGPDESASPNPNDNPDETAEREKETEEEADKGDDNMEGEDGDQGGYKEKEQDKAPEKETEKEPTGGLDDLNMSRVNAAIAEPTNNDPMNEVADDVAAELAAQMEEELTNDAADFPICCPCVRAGPTAKYMGIRKGLNLVVAPKRLLPVWVKEWNDTVKEHSLLDMTLLLRHGTVIQGVKTIKEFKEKELLMVAEAK
ncbi:hypothetical protein IFM53868_10729 [Aspergillus udagawae]|uniref:DNA2/NAM7 helicase helicase domain-containing protein n=1 Tax=Aspergillus udagawae TaxID=91492 RepID=A0ABQ1BEY1_9EURO|nr:hypothetical protein IFM53868_10729 [Aspergillus udagawae]